MSVLSLARLRRGEFPQRPVRVACLERKKCYARPNEGNKPTGTMPVVCRMFISPSLRARIQIKIVSWRRWSCRRVALEKEHERCRGERLCILPARYFSVVDCFEHPIVWLTTLKDTVRAEKRREKEECTFCRRRTPPSRCIEIRLSLPHRQKIVARPLWAQEICQKLR